MLCCCSGCLYWVQREERRYTLEQLIADHGKSVLVHLVVVQLMPEHLGSHVPGDIKSGIAKKAGYRQL